MNKKYRVLAIFVLTQCFIWLQGCSSKKTPEKDPGNLSQTEAELDRLNNLVMKDANNPDYLLQRASYFNGQKKFKNALNDMNRATSIDSTRADLWMTKAEALFGMVQVPQAVDAFQRVIAIDPTRTDAYLKLAELCLYVKDYQKSLNYANGALKTDSKRVKAYFIKGFIYKETGDTAKAISSFQTCVEVDPGYYEAHMQLGILHAAKNSKLALQYYNYALGIKPKSIEALYDRAMFYQESGDFNKAMEDYIAILRIDPRNKTACFNLGYIHLAYLKVYDQAVKYFTDAIRCDTNYIEAYYNRGISYENLGDIEHAASDYRKALFIYPKYELAKEGLRRVQN